MVKLGRLLPGRELLERLQELVVDRSGVEHDVVVVEEPVPVRVRRDVGPLERIGAQVEDLRHPQRDERLGPDPQRAPARAAP